MAQVIDAFERGAFDVRLPTYDLDWEQILPNLDQIQPKFQQLADKYIGANKSTSVRNRFLQVLQAELLEGERWNMLNLSMLHDYYPALERFKHAWTKHVVWIACFSATSPIPARPPGLMSLCKNERGSITGVAVLSVDGTFPPEVREDRDLSRRLLIEDTSPKDPSRLTRRRFRQVVLSMENCPHLWMEPVDVFPQFEPSDFKGDELMQLLHVHFRLSQLGHFQTSTFGNVRMCVFLRMSLSNVALKGIKRKATICRLHISICTSHTHVASHEPARVMRGVTSHFFPGRNRLPGMDFQPLLRPSVMSWRIFWPPCCA